MIVFTRAIHLSHANRQYQAIDRLNTSLLLGSVSRLQFLKRMTKVSGCSRGFKADGILDLVRVCAVRWFTKRQYRQLYFTSGIDVRC